MYRPLTSSIFDISFLQNIISYYTLPDAALCGHLWGRGAASSGVPAGRAGAGER